MRERWRLVPLLALADLRREWVMALCYVTALAAILAPVLVVDGLRVGVVDGLTRKLAEDPGKLRISLPGTYAFSADDIRELRALDGVGFLEPVHRAIATRGLLRTEEGRVERVDVLPSRAGDPLFGREAVGLALEQVAVSADLAERLGLEVGDPVWLHARRAGEHPARLDMRFDVARIVPADLLIGRQILATATVADALEAFRDGYALPEHGIAGRPPSERRALYENVRLYAADLAAVERLAETLRAGYGFRVAAAEDEVRRTRELARDLLVVFLLIGGVGLGGFVLALGSSLWANVERKRRTLGVLRLLGASRGELVAFPLTHALTIAALGIVLALLTAAAVGLAVNARFSDAPDDYAVFVMDPVHVAATLAVTLLATLAAATLSGVKASRLPPTEGMREA